jgi:pantoate--beta-alanine ligase
MIVPTVTRTRSELAAARAALPGRVAVVMTMGALHAGHLRLIDVARERADSVAVTIFVNPLQFGPGEDLDRYPRTFESDLAACAEHGVDLVFAPGVDDVYPPGEPVAAIHAGALGDRLEGAARPGHFDGVLTVVARLLDLVRPDLAVYGEKDAQQLALIRRMVAATGRPVEIVGVPTVREPDGLALSSRNRFLDAPARTAALCLSRALRAGATGAADGPAAALAAATAIVAGEPGVRADYVALVDGETWEEPSAQTRFARILVAARVGSTRLIDNVAIVLGTQEDPVG